MVDKELANIDATHMTEAAEKAREAAVAKYKDPILEQLLRTIKHMAEVGFESLSFNPDRDENMPEDFNSLISKVKNYVMYSVVCELKKRGFRVTFEDGYPIVIFW